MLKCVTIGVPFALASNVPKSTLVSDYARLIELNVVSRAAVLASLGCLAQLQQAQQNIRAAAFTLNIMHDLP